MRTRRWIAGILSHFTTHNERSVVTDPLVAVTATSSSGDYHLPTCFIKSTLLQLSARYWSVFGILSYTRPASARLAGIDKAAFILCSRGIYWHSFMAHQRATIATTTINFPQIIQLHP